MSDVKDPTPLVQDLDLKTLDADELACLAGRLHAEMERRDPGAGQGGQRGKGPCPARMFVVPKDIRFLDKEQLGRLTESFRTWAAKAKGPQQWRSRQRVYLVYLLVRFAGLKLGEVLSLDETRDLRLEDGRIVVRGDLDRCLPLPPGAQAQLRAFLDDPASIGLRGELFRLDPGFVRRKFYERGLEANLPRESLSPAAVRHSYAVELLRDGVPLLIVQKLLGHHSVAQTAHYVGFYPDDAREIVNFHLGRTPMKTSARNAFVGRVTAVKAGEVMSEVEMRTDSGLRVVSVVTSESVAGLSLAPGAPVTATVKAPMVILLKEAQAPLTSARNTFPGRVVKLTRDRISAEVVAELEDQTLIVALITDESAKGLDLKIGDPVYVLIKAFFVVLNRD